MDNDNKNNAMNQADGNSTNIEEKTFSQEDVNTIIKKRLSEERAKYGDYDELKDKAKKFDEIENKNKTDLQKAQENAEELRKQLEKLKNEQKISEIRAKVSSEKKIPAALLYGTTEEECQAQADAILAFTLGESYPKVTDSGEVQNKPSGSTREKFSAWFDEAIKK